VPHPRVYRGWGFSAMFSLLRSIGFVGLGRTLFADTDEGERPRQIQETKSKAGPANPTLPVRQNREGIGTHGKTSEKERRTALGDPRSLTANVRAPRRTRPGIRRGPYGRFVRGGARLWHLLDILCGAGLPCWARVTLLWRSHFRAKK